ncbi:MAG TPA: hypothetical protein VKV23_08740 [Acidimicrobiales bacterium]|nr:hypothetical protein [Acidimicrobiales bacterium]
MTAPMAADRSPSAERADAAWGFASRAEPRWPASLAIAVAIALYLVLPNRLTAGLGPRWLIPALAGALEVVLLVANPRHETREVARFRAVAIVLIALVNAANLVSLGELVNALLYDPRASGRALVLASVPIWLTNVIVFALWFWELDRGGPAARLRQRHGPPDFLFPQMSTPGATRPGWSPGFLDYLYTSFTNATAFSPTDTMPLSAWAKALMMGQALASLLTVALVVSRAVNILS